MSTAQPCWRFTVFLEPQHLTPCFAAYVQAENEVDALQLLRAELANIAIRLYVGEGLGTVSRAPPTGATSLATGSHVVHLVKLILDC